MSEQDAVDAIMAGLAGPALDELAELYRDLHRHPEPAFEEERTAGIAAERLRAAGFEVVTGLGGTGVAGVLRNGDGPTVALRADMDALPVLEATGLPYASTATTPGGVPLMHACGHDMHVACLIGATHLLAAGRDRWRGTLVALFQPAEEIAAGARAMLDDGLFDRIGTPDVVLGQHVFPDPAGTLLVSPARSWPPPTAWRSGCTAGAATAPSRSGPSTRSSWPPRPSCACRRSSRARSPRSSGRC